jgi:single-strand DNA-binding protein
MKGRAWGVDEVDNLKTMFERSIPDAYIAQILGRTAISIKVKRNKMHITGNPNARRYTKESKEKMRIKPTGANSPNWAGGRRTTCNGHIELFMPEHHRARKNGYVFEHIVVMEEKLNRKLKFGEYVHHIDLNKQNNEPNNLMLVSSIEHRKYHPKKREGVYKNCVICGEIFYTKNLMPESEKHVVQNARQIYLGGITRENQEIIDQRRNVNMLNKVILIGRLTADPTLRYTQSGHATSSFTLAVDRGRKNAQGEKEVDFIGCVAWKKTAEVVAEYTKKGSLMAIDGRLQVRTYDAKDGGKRWVTEVIAETVQFLDSKGDKKESIGQEVTFNEEDIPF